MRRKIIDVTVREPGSTSKQPVDIGAFEPSDEDEQSDGSFAYTPVEAQASEAEAPPPSPTAKSRNHKTERG